MSSSILLRRLAVWRDQVVGEPVLNVEAVVIIDDAEQEGVR